MGKEQPASYYDAGYKKSDEYKKNWRQSRYLKVWERMVHLLDKDTTIIDIGCGVGQTAGYLYHTGFKSYRGYDFSKQAIQMAKSSMNNVDDYKFNVCDVFEIADHYPAINPEQIQFFCSETLEHITKDIELLDLLRSKFPGASIAISVPTFDDPGHVRHFKSPADVKIRYCPYIETKDLAQIGPWIVLSGILLK